MAIVLLSMCVCLFAALFFFIMNIINSIQVKILDHYPDSEACPRVSVIVPARNEERTIGACVGSLLGQDYASFEIIVVNDHSEDNTAAILSALKQEHPELIVVDCAALPSGWTGKNWACHEGYGHAKADFVAFTDADTQHCPYALRKAVCAMIHENADFITVIPRLKTISWAEKSIMPLLTWLVYSVFPFSLMNRKRLRIAAFANGAFMMFRRDAYREIGGYAAIRDTVFDDMTLASRIRGAGMHCVVINGAAAIQCRMYANMKEIYSGLAKNIFRLFCSCFPKYVASALFVLCWLFFCAIYVVPVSGAALFFILLVKGTVIPVALPVCAGISILISLCSFFFVYAHFGYPWPMAFLYPINMVLLFTIAMNSIVRTLSGKTAWKGRPLH